MKSNLKNLFFTFYFVITAVISFLIGLLFYDSTKGLDYNKYFKNLNLFLGNEETVYDSSGTLYYYLVAAFVNNQIENTYIDNLKLLYNYSIQSVNFFLFLIGGAGLYIVFKQKGFKNFDLVISLSIICYLPTAYYFRLTMKPEVMAFALFPWCIYLLDKFFESKNLANTLSSVVILTILLTLKPSISGMVFIAILLFYRNNLKSVKNIFILSFSTLVSSLFFILYNYRLTGVWLFARPVSLENADKWNNIASFSFYTNIDLINLYQNPYQYLHSDSFISITLLDTLADYFHFFWNHEEVTNYIAFDKVKFSDNFLIQEFLNKYISISFTVVFYFLVVFLIFQKSKNTIWLSLPFFGWVILIINSFGIPSKNFDPLTGDLFKVHYYSFFFTISFFVLILHFLSKYKLTRLLIFFLLPLFLSSIGFPKNLSQSSYAGIQEKIVSYNMCKLTKYTDNFSC